MNIQEYIASGIIESYCLGLASPEEAAEFEQYCTQYPELVQARTAFETALEKKAFENTSAPDPSVKENLLQTLFPAAAPVIDIAGRKRNTNWLAAASLILLALTSVFAVYQYSQNRNLRSSTARLQNKLDSIQKDMDKMAEQEQMMMSPGVAVVNLMPTTPAMPASANVYWDSTSTDVYLVIRNMPEMPTEKQYQLWALINGQPKDLGLFDGGKRVILKMKNTQKAEAFAITIEKRGNTGGPSSAPAAMGKTSPPL